MNKHSLEPLMCLDLILGRWQSFFFLFFFSFFFSRRNRWWAVICRVLLPKDQRWMVNTHAVQKAKGEWCTPVKLKRQTLYGEHRCAQNANGEWWTPVKLKRSKVHGEHPWSSKFQLCTVNTREAQKAKGAWWTPVKFKMPKVHGKHPWSSNFKGQRYMISTHEAQILKAKGTW